MELRTKRGLIAGVADRWKRQYADHPDKNGEKAAILTALRALPADATEDDVAQVIGNRSWTRNDCEECGRDVDVTVRLGEEPDYESITLYACPDCLRAALELAAP